MTQHHITDARHLSATTQRGIAALMDLDEAWRDEDAAACAPPANGQSTRSNSAADQTGSIATVERNRYRDRDQLGRDILTAVNRLEEIRDRRKPRTPDGRACRCCNTRTATHGHDRHGKLILCWHCWRYQQHNGYPCDDELHALWPTTRMCECPPNCCDVCPDQAEEGRRVSRRCRQRKEDGKWERDAHTQ